MYLMVDLKEKKFLILDLSKYLDQQIDTANRAATSAKESKFKETKSTAGDKFETGRAMMQKEQEMNESFLLQKKTLKAKLLQIDLFKEYEKIEFGSLVETNLGKYFLSIGLGKYKVLDHKYFVVSIDSPVAISMLGKRVGDLILRNGQEQKIIDIC